MSSAVGGRIPHSTALHDTGWHLCLFWATVCKNGLLYAIRPLSVLSVGLSCPVLSVCNVRVLWPNGWTDGHIVLDGDPAPPPQRSTAPIQFSANICCGQLAAWVKMPLGMELGLSPGDFVLDGDPALPSPKKGAEPPPQFSAHFYCGQTAACIKMEVGLSPGDYVRWDPPR